MGTATVLGATTVQTVGGVIAVLATIGFVVYLIVNLRAGRQEIGSEIELAPNRKRYHDDDTLETTKLNRTLVSAFGLLGVVAVALPLYWLNEPSRQENAVAGGIETAAGRGLEQYETGSQCVNCHSAEGTGGQAAYTILDSDGLFVAQVNWTAPALNTVLLRFSREEVAEIITYGRPGTPMAPWGAEGGGPRTTQEIDNIIEYINSVQLSSEDAQRATGIQLATELGLLEEGEEDEDAIDAALEQIDYQALATGEALFNIGRNGTYAGGASACGRCHTRGWSIITEGDDPVQPPDVDISDYVDYEPGSGGFGPPLDQVVPRQFASVDELAEFIGTGTVLGEGYGRQGQGDGMMPGFGDDPNTEEVEGDGMLSPEMVCAIATYVTTLNGDEPPTPDTTTTTTAPTTTTTVPAGEEAEEEEEPQPGYCEAAYQGGSEESPAQ
jgi:mono/diheme cytochrome c family protein